MCNFFNGLLNSYKLYKLCFEIIDKYQSGRVDFSCDCKDVLKRPIKSIIKNSFEEIASWSDLDTDYVKIAHVTVSNLIYDMLSSGQYHLYKGILRPGAPRAMKEVYLSCLRFGVEHNYITFSESQECIKNLEDNISYVG